MNTVISIHSFVAGFMLGFLICAIGVIIKCFKENTKETSRAHADNEAMNNSIEAIFNQQRVTQELGEEEK